MHTIRIGPVAIGSEAPLAIIAGPCVAESLDMCLTIAATMQHHCAELGLGYIFKASFDKANRSSIHSYRGPSLETGLAWMAQVKKQLNLPVTTDVHESTQASAVGQVVDLLQIPAFLCRQTDLLVACARTGKAVNVKKGQFLSPGEMRNVVDKLVESGADQAGIMLTERGTFFGYHRLINDFVGLVDMMDYHWPVCFDVTHSTQQPGGQGTQSGGRPERAPMLAKCAVTAGVQALFMEVHPEPAKALSDAATMLKLHDIRPLLEQLTQLHGFVRKMP